MLMITIRYELVKGTNMVDYVESLYGQATEAGAQAEGQGAYSFESRSRDAGSIELIANNP